MVPPCLDGGFLLDNSLPRKLVDGARVREKSPPALWVVNRDALAELVLAEVVLRI